ncbi:hypothetical protein DRQ29_04600 [bacterium]|nr:MAG: hypothetical protein DRQ29_04600 [bacterium]
MKSKIFTITAIIYSVALFSMSLIPKFGPGQMFPFADKITHFGAFIVLGFLVVHSIREFKNIRHIWIYALIIASVYGILMEIAQGYIPGRECNIFDWIADFLGASAGVFIKIPSRLKRIEKKLNSK